MMSGLGFNKGFVSLIALCYFMLISHCLVIQIMILENRMSFYQYVDRMDRNVFVEVVVMQRIKEEFLENRKENCTLFYEEYMVTIRYDGEEAIVTYDNFDENYQRVYRYDENSGMLELEM